MKQQCNVFTTPEKNIGPSQAQPSIMRCAKPQVMAGDDGANLNAANDSGNMIILMPPLTCGNMSSDAREQEEEETTYTKLPGAGKQKGALGARYDGDSRSPTLGANESLIWDASTSIVVVKGIGSRSTQSPTGQRGPTRTWE